MKDLPCGAQQSPRNIDCAAEIKQFCVGGQLLHRSMQNLGCPSYPAFVDATSCGGQQLGIVGKKQKKPSKVHEPAVLHLSALLVGTDKNVPR